MSPRPICDLCGKSSPEDSQACVYCGNGFSSDEEWMNDIIGAPTWGCIHLSIHVSARSNAVLAALQNQWKSQEDKPTQQRLFPFQAEKFVEGVKQIELYCPKDSYLTLAKFIAVSFADDIELSFSEMAYNDIYAIRDLWLANRLPNLTNSC